MFFIENNSFNSDRSPLLMTLLNSMGQSTRPFILPLFFIREHCVGSLFVQFQKSPFKAKNSQFSSSHFENRLQ
jgi:hypothetical protein